MKKSSKTQKIISDRIQIKPGSLTGKQAAKMIDEAQAGNKGKLHYTDCGINRMSLSMWRRNTAKPDKGSCYKLVDFLNCQGVPAVLVMTRSGKTYPQL